MGDEPETTQVEEVPSETPPLDSNGHNNVEAENKNEQKIKRQDSPKKKDKRSSKRKYSSSSDESDSDSEKDIAILTMAHQQNLQRKKCPRMSIPHQGSLPSLSEKE